MRSIPLIGCIVLAALSPTVSAEADTNASRDSRALSLYDVLKSTMEHHPRIVQAMSLQEQADGVKLETRGAFDWQVEQESFARTSGFYSGWLVDQSISRRLPFANAKVSGGYRISDGTFPIYEDINRTLDGGEANISVSFSLLRDREIDKNRAAIAEAEFGLDIANQRQKLIINDLLLEAALQYLKWKQSAERRKIFERLFKLAQDRQQGIVQKVSAGELARITLTEFEATLLQREAELLAIYQSLEIDGIGLSFFLRNADGQPQRVPNGIEADWGLNKALAELPNQQRLLDALLRHPDIVRLEGEIAQLKTQLQLNENSLLPQLDLKVNVANDVGGGSTTLDGLESYVGLDFSVPLGQRAARGKVNQTRAKLNETTAKHQEVMESLDIKLNQALAALENLLQLRDLRDQQALVAEKLMEQEQARFEAGDSDLFLLNARESNFARAELAALDAHINLLRQHFVVLAGSATLDEKLN